MTLKNFLFLYLMLGSCCSFFSCSSGNGVQDGAEQNTSSEKATANDSSPHGLAGIIEKNPPVQQGNYVVKYPNGIVKIRGYYINGKRNGQWISFFENGTLQSEGFFKDGLRDGKAVVYYENGQVYYQGYYKEGREAGKWIFYSPDGKIIQEKNYEDSNQ